MASLRKLPSGKWAAEVFKLGVRKTKAFERKAEAQSWAAATEAAIIAGSLAKYSETSMADALDKYVKQVSSQKRGGETERKRIDAIKRDFPDLVAKPMHEVTTTDLAEWRDARLAKVTKGSVQRDINLLRNVWTVAAHEWKMCEAPGPWHGLRSPGENKPRERRVGMSEVRMILRWGGYRTGHAPKTKACEAVWAFLLSMHTALRPGEIIGLTLDRIDLAARVLTLDTHKTLEVVGVRRVPITRRAARLLAILAEAAKAAERDTLFTQTPRQLDGNWRKLLSMCNVQGLQFRDSRAEALTRLSRKMDVMTLARISGHRDLKILLNTYYRETAEQIAARI